MYKKFIVGVNVRYRNLTVLTVCLCACGFCNIEFLVTGILCKIKTEVMDWSVSWISNSPITFCSSLTCPSSHSVLPQIWRRMRSLSVCCPVLFTSLCPLHSEEKREAINTSSTQKTSTCTSLCFLYVFLLFSALDVTSENIPQGLSQATLKQNPLCPFRTLYISKLVQV